MAVARLNIPNATWIYNIPEKDAIDASNWTPYLTNVWEVERWSRRIQCPNGYLSNDWTTIPFYGATHEWDPHHAEMFYIRLERWSQRICRRLHVPYKKWGFEKPRNAQLEIANWRAIMDWARSIEACCGGTCPPDLFDVTFTTPPPLPRASDEFGVGIFHQDTLLGTGGLPALKKVTIVSEFPHDTAFVGDPRVFIELGTPEGVGVTNSTGFFPIAYDGTVGGEQTLVVEGADLDNVTFQGSTFPRFTTAGGTLPGNHGPTMPNTTWQVTAQPSTFTFQHPGRTWQMTITLEWQRDCHFWEAEDPTHPAQTHEMTINTGWELSQGPF